MRLFFFIFIFLLLNSGMAYSMTNIDLDVTVNLNDKALYGIAKISNYEISPEFNNPGIEILHKTLKKENEKDVIFIEYKTDIGNILENSRMFSADDFLFLYDNWFPEADNYAIYSLKVSVPEGFIPISEADEVKENKGKYEFIFNHPRDEITLIVGKFHKNSIKHRDIDISTYFLENDRNLSNLYLTKTGQFLDKYQKLLGKFPFKKFSVVENPAQTGYGFPTFTLLGSAVLRLPFIPDTSLGHELAHSWWGNSIYNDFSKGNWIEGLTTYLSDYHYEKEKNADTAYRKNIIVKYMSYNDTNSTPLMDFKGNIDNKNESIGYGKGAFLFYTLENEMGEKNFYDALKDLINTYSFKEASWDDIKDTFNKYSQNKLDTIFDQRLKRNDIPDINISSNELHIDEKGEFLLKITVNQGTKIPYNLTVPLIVETLSGKQDFDINISGEKQDVYLNVNNFPLKVIIDPQYKIMRKLSPNEYPPVFSRVIGAKSGIMTIHKSEREIYSEAIDFFTNKNKNYEIIEIDDNSAFEWEKYNTLKSIIFMGTVPKPIQKIIKKQDLRNSGVSIDIINNIANNSIITLLRIDKKEEFTKIKRKLFHYGNYSKIVFSDGKTIEKALKNTEDGIIYNIYNPIMGYNKDSILTFNDIINQIANKKIVFVGEEHDKYAHHLLQLMVIKALNKKGVKLAVGMEMFQKPFQKALDDYIESKISEQDFLSQSEYLKRWSFDYKLYKPIIDYCRANNIRIIALNAPVELTKKISEKGIGALTPEEQENIPNIDITNNEHKDFVNYIFSSHNISEKKDFTNFYMAQLLWDETMADTAHNFLKNNPVYKMVILAGNGHIENRYGIPNRLTARGDYDITTITNESVLEINPEKADFSIIMPYFEQPFSARLGVTLEEMPDGLLIKDIDKNSVAMKSNLHKNDIILFADDVKISNLFSLKAILSMKKQSDTIKLKIKRKKQDNQEEYEELEIISEPFDKTSRMPFEHPK